MKAEVLEVVCIEVIKLLHRFFHLNPLERELREGFAEISELIAKAIEILNELSKFSKLLAIRLYGTVVLFAVLFVLLIILRVGDRVRKNGSVATLHGKNKIATTSTIKADVVTGMIFCPAIQEVVNSFILTVNK
jgi:hypothetical protein